MLTIWHNPRCSKSRQTLALVEASGKDHRVRRYLEDGPTLAEVKGMLFLLGLGDPRQMMRTGEKLYRELDLKSEDSADALLKAMAENPILIERPIVSDGQRAIIGRPPEAVQTLL